MKLQPTPRQTEILRLVRLSGSCSIGELAERLSVSDETIRRTVKPLVAQGLVLKVHGGIVLPDRLEEPAFPLRMQENRSAKETIARLLLTRIENGDSLMLDTGSTTAYVARALTERSNLTVVTNSTEIANLLATRNGNRVFIAGGEVRAHDAATFGPEAVSFIRKFTVQHAILSIAALDETRGFMDYHLCEADFSQAVMAQAERVIVVADSSKFNRTSLVQVAELEAADLLVTETPPEGRLAERLAAAEVEVLAPSPLAARVPLST